METFDKPSYENNKRAERIFGKTEECHKLLDEIYEKLVDREFECAQKDIQSLIVELDCLSKSIKQDDF